MDYGIEEHRHRFSVWAAARAAQRGFTTVGKLRDALSASKVREFLKSPEAESIDAEAFEKRHREWCHAIILSLTNAGVEKVTYGRAAKLIAVYLKSAVVLGRRETSLSRVAHPPIDRILLSQLVAAEKVESEHKTAWATMRWTSLDEAQYYQLVEQLRTTLASGEPFWMLEQYWIVANEDEH
jgi:hypothetical protein